MEAHPHTITQVFSDGGYIQYILPHFQREYTWDVKDWKAILEDTFAVYQEFADTKPPEHFMGSLVRISNGARNGISTFTLVDGQQRLTTISLMLCALRDIVHGLEPASDKQIDLHKQINRMLINPDERELSRYKILPTSKHGDRLAYTAILDGKPIPHSDSNIPLAFAMLHDELKEKILAGDTEVHRLFGTIMRCLQVVTIDLKADERPYKIFESLNAKGKDLTPADLIRNYIAMTLPDTVQDEVFRTQWAYVDDALQEKNDVGSSGFGELTGFFRHYLAMRTENLYNKDHIYARFRDRIERDFSSPEAFIAEIATLRRFASYYDKLLRPEHESQPSIQGMLLRLRVFEMSTAFPFLLRAYDAYETGSIAIDEFTDLLKSLESYVVRRFLCGKQANYLNTMFPTLWKEIDRERFNESLKEAIATKQFPTNEDVRQAIRTAKKYAGGNLRRLGLVFDSINRRLSEGTGGYTVPDAPPTIEHIMPQSPPTEAWKAELGDDWEEVHERYRHTLGNLTLVTQSWNSSLSNDPFVVKKAKLAENGLRINSVYFSKIIGAWTEESILERADWLADRVLEIWPSFGAAAATVETGTSIKARSVIIMGDEHAVGSWRDVMHRTAIVVSEWVGEDFPEFVKRFPNNFSIQPFKYHPRQLPNGWWVYVNLSRIDTIRYCREMIVAAGIPHSEWVVKEDSDQ
jgi:uncharacterized protein with ParB-like and HNH nuclease domain